MSATRSRREEQSFCDEQLLAPTSAGLRSAERAAAARALARRAAVAMILDDDRIAGEIGADQVAQCACAACFAQASGRPSIWLKSQS